MAAAAVLLAAFSPNAARAQGPAEQTPGAATGFVVRDSGVGYVDSAVIADQLRLRYDFAAGITSGSRAEFLYTRPGSGANSLPLAETDIRYQDITFVLERELHQRLSALVELPVRFLDPFQNESAAGLGDMNVAVKYALLDDASLLTAQLRVYIPTGEADRGLGNHHVSIEPALLCFQPLGNQWNLEGELRYWIAVGGGELAGSVVRYGLGVHRPLWNDASLVVRPVVEVVGWSVLEGAETRPTESMSLTPVNARGATIVNGKFGLRLDTRSGWDLYLGYGRALTGETWYEDIARAELRFNY